MGTYYIPRNYKGETRLLYIFSIKSLITTALGGVIGLVFFLIFIIVPTILGYSKKSRDAKQESSAIVETQAASNKAAKENTDNCWVACY